MHTRTHTHTHTRTYTHIHTRTHTYTHTHTPQHTLGHHPYTNIDGADPDIVTASAVSCGGVLFIYGCQGNIH